MRLVTSALAGAVVAASAAAAHAVMWIDDLDAARAKAQKENRLLLVDFYADWCAPCRAMDAQVWNQPEVAELAARLVCARVDAVKFPAALQYYAVQGLPTMLFLDPTGREAYRALGFRSAADMAAILRPFPGSLADIDALLARVEREEENDSLRLRLGDAYREHGMYTLSSECYARLVDSDLAERDAAMRERLSACIALDTAAKGEWKNAERLLEECLETYPKAALRPQILRALVEVTARIGARKKARGYLTALEKEFPADPNTAAARPWVNPAP